MTPDQAERARAFAALHVPGDPLVLFNVWDAGSARAVADAGAQAIATGSWSVAAAQGYADGEALPIDLAIANIARIAAAVTLPVSIDFEGGYAADPDGVAANFARALDAGAIGCNFEDQLVGGEGLYPIADQAARIAALRAVSADAFINARTDLFLKAAASAHDLDLVEAALRRADAYAKAGADGFFAPGLRDEALIAALCQASPLPVNIIVFPGFPERAQLAAAGVARISHGPGPYRMAMAAVTEAARAAMGG